MSYEVRFKIVDNLCPQLQHVLIYPLQTAYFYIFMHCFSVDHHILITTFYLFIYTYIQDTIQYSAAISPLTFLLDMYPYNYIYIYILGDLYTDILIYIYIQDTRQYSAAISSHPNYPSKTRCIIG
jgi:hypothetical protein